MHRIATIKIYCFVIGLLLLYRQEAYAQVGNHQKQSITYNFSATVLWQLGAATLAANPLDYYFFPFTYTRKISDKIAYTQFVMYRYEHYKSIRQGQEDRYSIWRNFHEFYVLSGLRFYPQDSIRHGKYLAFCAGFGRGLGPNLSLWTMNFMPEVGSAAKPLYKHLFLSWNLGLLFSAPLHQFPTRYTWDQFSTIGIIAHMITPIFGLNMGWTF